MRRVDLHKKAVKKAIALIANMSINLGINRIFTMEIAEKGWKIRGKIFQTQKGYRSGLEWHCIGN